MMLGAFEDVTVKHTVADLGGGVPKEGRYANFKK